MTEEDINEILNWKIIFMDENSLIYKFREEFKRIRTENINMKKEIEDLKAKLKYSEENNHDLREQVDWLEEQIGD